MNPVPERKPTMPIAEAAASPVDLVEATTRIVCAHLAVAPTLGGELPELIRLVSGALRHLDQSTEAAAATARPDPAVPVRASFKPDYIVCLEDGRRLKMLKRYLATRFDLTPDQYRQRWGLPADYPMVAPNYKAKRSALAKSIGLGHMRKAG